MPEEVLVVFTTWPDAGAARAAARTLVGERLIACANLLPGIESIYKWKGTIETGVEILVLMKTTVSRYRELESRIRALHPCEVPEIVSLRAGEGLPAYLQWVQECCNP